MSLKGAAVTILACTAALVGCGESELSGEDDSPEAVAAAVNSYFSSLAAQDAGATCDKLTDTGRRILVKVLRYEGDPDGPDIDAIDPSDCEAALTDAEGGPAEGELRVRPSQVSIDGNDATVSDPGSGGNAMALSYEDGQWLVEVPIFTGR